MPKFSWKGFVILLVVSSLIQWYGFDLYACHSSTIESPSISLSSSGVDLLKDTIPSSLNEPETTDSLDKQGRDTLDRQGGTFVRGANQWMEQKARAAQKYYAGWKAPDASRSALYSALLPGAGQVYNRQSWKLGLVWGGIGITLYNLDNNISQYRRFRDAYELSVMGVEHELSFLSENALKSYRDQFRSNLELNYIALGAIYVFNILEAFISGHLAGFDVSDDLSLRFPPGDQVAPLQMSCVYTF